MELKDNVPYIDQTASILRNKYGLQLNKNFQRLCVDNKIRLYEHEMFIIPECTLSEEGIRNVFYYPSQTPLWGKYQRAVGLGHAFLQHYDDNNKSAALKKEEAEYFAGKLFPILPGVKQILEKIAELEINIRSSNGVGEDIIFLGIGDGPKNRTECLNLRAKQLKPVFPR